jgi:hypothetical protein
MKTFPLALAALVSVAYADTLNTMKAIAPLLVTADPLHYAIATGAWDLNIPSHTRNAVEIQCSREARECVGAEAYVDQAGGGFSVHMYRWRITSWTSAEVVAEDIDACTTGTLTVNFAYKEVVQVTRNGGSVKDCAESRLLKHPITKKLISGEWNGSF